MTCSSTGVYDLLGVAGKICGDFGEFGQNSVLRCLPVRSALAVQPFGSCIHSTSLCARLVCDYYSLSNVTMLPAKQFICCEIM